MSAPVLTPPPPLAAPPKAIVARDFPGWLPPMLVKELRQGLRTRGFVGTLIGFQLVMLVLTLVALGTESASSSTSRAASAALTGFFWVVVAVQLIFVTPSRALAGLQLEVEARTLDLLMLTRLTAWRVVLGKWVSLLAQATLLLIAMLPYLVVRYFTDNADLVADFGRCLVMLGVSAVLTAAGLWGSGLAKLVRVLMAVALVFVMANVIGIFGPLFSGRSGPARGPFANLFDLPFDLINGAVLTAYFLVSAVRNIAPVAENHGLFARTLPLLALLPVPFAAAFGSQPAALRQLYVSAAFLAFVALFEMASPRTPMPIHWREWHQRGPLARLLGRLTLPGWASAFVFSFCASVVWLAVAGYVLPGGSSSLRLQLVNVTWLGFLGFAAIAFPAVVLSFVPRLPVPRPVVYLAGLTLPGLLAGLALALAESRWRITGFKSVMETLPVSSFLFALNKIIPGSPAFLLQGAVAGLVVLTGAWQTRAHWRQLGAYEARERAARRPPVA